MDEKYLALLNKQIEKLDSDDFDLEAWKGSSVAILSRIYDPNDIRIKQIEELLIDYSSWALRDAKSTYDPMGSCKRRGKEILQVVIDELEAFGIPERNNGNTSEYVLNALESELTITQFKTLKKALSSKSDDQNRLKAVVKEIKKWDSAQNASILAQIVIKSELEGKLS